MSLPIEFERKFTPAHSQEAERLCEDAPYVDIEQYYISNLEDPIELRVRAEHFPAGHVRYSTALKIGTLPSREELEVQMSEEAYEYWAERSAARALKRRYFLPFTAGKLVLDNYLHRNTWIAELEGSARTEVPDLRQSWSDVTEQQAYRGRYLATPLQSPEAETEPTEQTEIIREIIEKQLDSRASIVVGIAGGTASGKTTFAKKLQQATDGLLISTDDYYRGKTFMREAFGYEESDINWDHPESFNLPYIRDHIGQLAIGKTIAKPQYSMVACDPLPETERITALPRRPIIVEGLYTLLPEVNDVLDIGLYVDAPQATRVARRITRDMSARETSWPIEDNFRYLMQTAEPTFDKHGLPQKNQANIVINT